MKRHLSILLAALLVVGAFGPLMASAQDEVTLRLLTNWSPDDSKGPALASIIEDFEAAYPNISIELEYGTDQDIPTKVETAFLAGEEPDLVLQNLLGITTEWEANGVTIPVTDLIEEWGLKDQFRENALQEYTINDELVAFPLEGFNWPIWYNMDILAEAGIEELPVTWAEFMDVALAVREAGYQPFALGGQDWTGGDFLMTALIGTLTDEELVAVLQEGAFAETEKVVEFFNAFVEWRDAGVFVDNAEGLEFSSMNEMFFSGDAAMMHGGSWSYAELPEELQSVVQLGGIPLPPGSPYEKPFWYNAYGAKGLWITRNGEEKLDAVSEFVKFFFQPEMIARFVEQSGMIPPLTNVPVNEDLLSPVFVLSLGIDVDAIPPEAFAYMPTSISFDGGWYGVTALAFVPGTSADEIIAAIEDLYSQVE